MKEGTGHGGDNDLPKEEVKTTEEKKEEGWFKKAVKKAGSIVGGAALHVGLPAAVSYVTAKVAVGDWTIPGFGKKSTAEETTRNEDVAQPRGEFRNNNNGGYRNNNNYQPRG